jgi:DNA polymerase-3 subunit gamma/tau
MGQALYRKYRSKSLSEIVGQEHITQTLEEALKQGRISHAYLFTGPRGVGKTSIARILAHEINQIPYEDDSMHLDIIEIDAASNRRIDEIRELRDKVYIAPTTAKYKVYIIDEVHMLTKEAFNALLKTLEEPPAHAVFILATTDAHKLPDTIVSRTQRYTFKPVEKDKVVAHLKDIAKQEKITISDDALGLLAEHGEGSFRDSISLLDQASSHGKRVDLNDVLALLGIPSEAAIDEVLQAVAGNDPALLMTKLTQLYDQGFQAAAIAKLLGHKLRTQLIESTAILPVHTTLELLAQLVETPASHNPERYLEICLLQVQTPAVQMAAPVPVPAAKVVAAQPVIPEVHEAKPAPMPEPIPETPPVEPQEAPQAVVAGSAVLDTALWPQVLQSLKQTHNTLYGVVRMAQPSFEDDGTLRIAFAFAFHQKRLNDPRNKQVLVETIHRLTGKSVQIECVLDKTAKASQPIGTTPAPQPVAKDTTELKTISNIFGGGELLES